jgi:DNA-binding NarL/FixJ family response regulator
MKTESAPIPLTLSKRQQEILRAACLGASDKLIAERLGLSPRTLEGHWRAIHRKLGSENRCQAGFIFAVLEEGGSMGMAS